MTSYAHTVAFETTRVRPGMAWLGDVGRDRMRIIGSLEILGAIRLTVPAATGILRHLRTAPADG